MAEKIWFITGASRGFGHIWTEAALARGDKVAATARNTATLDDLCERFGGNILPLALDVTDHDAVMSTVNEAHRRFGRLDVVLTNAGDKAFSAGMDLKAFASGQGNGILAGKHGFAGIAHRAIPKPIIAAVNGVALAGGFEIVLSCDLVVAVEHASFGIPEVKRGLLAAGGGLIRLPKRLPLAIALELALTGDPIDAQRAFELGLVNQVVPAAELLDAALALAERITPNSPLAVRRSKAVMVAAAQVSEEAGWEISQEATRIVFGGPDAQEGATAFAEKRPPNWQVE